MIDWNSTAHVLQVILWALAVFAFVMGYSMGNRL